MASHFALFVDLENCGGKKSMLMDVIERVKIRGDILIGKVYGYTDSYSDLKEILLSNTFAVVPSLRFGRNQKNSLDIQLVIDALDVAYTNPLIDSFCIVSGDSDYVPLVGKLKTMGKFVLGISRSEAASGVFMNACSEFQFLESVASGKERAQGQEIEALTLADVNDLIVTILKESDSGEMLASEVKSVLLRLRPNFSEKSVGFSTFGKLIARLSQQFGAFSVESEQFNVIVSLNQPHVTAGEQISISLLAMAIERMGFPVISLLGWQAGFNTNAVYGAARIKNIKPNRLQAELAKRNIVVVAGFQGLNRYDDLTTLGRGGSDTSAVAIAAALNADKCQIFTDVEGVYTADPRKVENAQKLKEITYDEMLELATLGAQVLNNRSVEMAKKYGVELEVLSSLNPIPGTIVKEVAKMEKMLIRGVTKDKDVARISVIGLKDTPGVAFKIFSKLRNFSGE